MPSSRGISIIIPTYNEASTIKVLLDSIFNQINDNDYEVILVDSDKSKDNLKKVASIYNFQYVKANHTCRAIQLNIGARMAKYDILYFVHADVILPKGFHEKIYQSIDNGNSFGYFRYQFDSKKFLLKINSFFSQYKSFYTGGGDQTFFIRKEVFHDVGGFDDELKLCEDFALFDKLKNAYQYEIINSKVIVSSRKYQKANYFKVNLVNLYILLKFKKGHNTHELRKTYERLLA